MSHADPTTMATTEVEDRVNLDTLLMLLLNDLQAGEIKSVGICVKKATVLQRTEGEEGK